MKSDIDRLMAERNLDAIIVSGPDGLTSHNAAWNYMVRGQQLTGTVVKLEWTNPHARLYVDGVDKTGAKVTFNFEMASPNILERNGWTRKSVAPMDTVVIEGYEGRVDSSRGIANSVKFSDGRSLFAGAPDQRNN